MGILRSTGDVLGVSKTASIKGPENLTSCFFFKRGDRVASISKYFS